MKNKIVFIAEIVFLLATGCVPVEKMSRHNFDSGFYKLKTNDGQLSSVYATVSEDSVVIYPLKTEGRDKIPDIFSSHGTKISTVRKDNYFYKSCFKSNSIDVDLTSVILKYRFPEGGVPNQLSSNVNAALYIGLRKDFYKLIPYKTPLNEETSYIRQIGFDAGIFAGMGITPVNPTVTKFQIAQEYDGVIFQKGIAGFITFDNISVGVALGFDNLLDKNRNLWIYNQKPYLGLVIGISNF
jgi:hypothetical protein